MLFLILLILFLPAAAQSAGNPDLLSKAWQARWIAPASGSPFDYGVYHFRRSFDLERKPERFLVHLTADQRYQLFVNGRRVVSGPARGDLFHWRYESVDLAPYLTSGRNVLAAVVWHFGEHTPIAQISYRVGFLLQGDGALEKVANTGPDWRTLRNEAYSPVVVTHAELRGYYVAGPAERFDAARYPWGWEQPAFDDSSWPKSVPLDTGAPRPARDAHSRHMLVPRPIPLMEERPVEAPRLRRAEGIHAAALPVTVPPNTKATFLLDQSVNTAGYPELTLSGGAGATLRLGYAEALFDPKTRAKGNRDEIEGKIFVGAKDTILPDGAPRRVYRPLWWRTWRYLQLSVETAAAPVTVDSLAAAATGYPWVRKASFDAAPEELRRMLDVGWRTLRLCTHETYMDTPYYEQLQYVGDTRIQALATFFETADGRLARNAIEQVNSSRTPEGATYSRAPSALQQYIPGFSLWWIGMLHDYWMYQPDEAFVKEMLPGARAVLTFFGSLQKPNGSLGPLPWWPYVDWVNQWPNGMPPAEQDGSSAPHDLQLLLAYQWAARMEAALGSKAHAAEYAARAERLTALIPKLYWDETRKLYADTPAKQKFSQHANALAVLAGLTKGEAARALMERTVADTTLAPASIYFRYYLNRAAIEAGLGDQYLDLLDEWRTMLSRGLTTWAEKADPTRSDCHAWGASPNIELYRTILGVDSAAPGFKRVTVTPHLGKLDHASGSVPHPAGEIRVALKRTGPAHLEAEIHLPAGVTGEFSWNGTRTQLAPGRNRFVKHGVLKRSGDGGPATLLPVVDAVRPSVPAHRSLHREVSTSLGVGSAEETDGSVHGQSSQSGTIG
ncbi:MAG: alpha-L-rhamnosidase C-terminal domain-containing protein [Bryobacteraceae bacterium]|nr:alpha-L-rhamnosidase C-terminal domain-containing protein [Bryobacteraceae bacterium]